MGLLELRLASNFYSCLLSAGIIGKCQHTQFFFYVMLSVELRALCMLGKNFIN